uniref:Uncharacterized protein n=1 Tax=Physcomitrium patens TaxID=3218 RepID=A0A2K1K470_PHYPA|nr:hypothetical protein PHYPA_013035 [Physcomitrium patens]
MTSVFSSTDSTYICNTYNSTHEFIKSKEDEENSASSMELVTSPKIFPNGGDGVACF